MSYRPEGWDSDKIFQEVCDTIHTLTDEEYEDQGTSKRLIEAGADAMLEWLCQPESLVDTEQKLKQAIASLPLITKSRRGYLVFIEKEHKKYRPEGFKNPYEYEHELEGEYKMASVVYEEGFNAAIEALKKQAIQRVDCDEDTISTRWMEGVKGSGLKGYLVFIEE